jgi:hypothetical protein
VNKRQIALRPSALVSLLTVAACATAIVFPRQEQFSENNTSYGQRYTVRSGLGEIVNRLRSYVNEHRAQTTEDIDGTNGAVVTTQYVETPIPVKPRQQRRVAYQVMIRRRTDLVYEIQVRCVSQARGKYERTWKDEASEGFNQSCYSPFSEGLDNVIFIMQSESRQK